MNAIENELYLHYQKISWRAQNIAYNAFGDEQGSRVWHQVFCEVFNNERIAEIRKTILRQLVG